MQPCKAAVEHQAIEACIADCFLGVSPTKPDLVLKVLDIQNSLQWPPSRPYAHWMCTDALLPTRSPCLP